MRAGSDQGSGAVGLLKRRSGLTLWARRVAPQPLTDLRSFDLRDPQLLTPSGAPTY
jgi:hypothetical protein